MPAMSSMAAGRFTITSCLVSSSEPRAKVVVVAIFMSMGIAVSISITTRDQAADLALQLRAAEVEMLQTRKGAQFAGVARHLRVIEVEAGLRLPCRGGPPSSAPS